MDFTSIPGSTARLPTLTCDAHQGIHATMTLESAHGRRLPIALLLVSLLIAFGASALSRRDQTGADAVAAKMAAAEARYRAALVKLADADPEGQKESDAALEDMEDAVSACTHQAGCDVGALLVTYERLLKQAADGEGALDDVPGNGGTDAARGAIYATGNAGAASLLDARTHQFDEMVQSNPAVQAAIRRWLTDMRGQLRNTFDNYQYLRPQMWPTYQKVGLPEALLFGIMAKESNGKVHVQSRTGAAGPLQFMYATGLRFGLGQDATGFDTRFDPHASAEASAAYLNEQMAQLGGSIELSLAAYNGGEGRARRVYQSTGGRGFWNADVYNQFPEETQDYVPMVIAAAWLFMHPKEYGLDIDHADTSPASLVLQKPASIYELTICLGDSGTRDGYLRTLRNLNPRYQADSWLPTGTSLRATQRMTRVYAAQCVDGPRAALAQRLMQSDASAAIVHAAAPAQDRVASAPKQPTHYSVQRGETLSSIARKFQCNAGDLARANSIRAPRYSIRPGQKLSLKGCDAS
jgi:membrane-bound lytic murein transglycosylase D